MSNPEDAASVAGETYLYLTTTGRRTGRARTIEIWFTEAAGRLYVIAERGERADWVRNIRRDPRVAVRVGERRVRATARVLDRPGDAARRRRVAALSEAKYGWGDGLIVELLPDGPPAPS
jgi:deazaflavin-dependent oxidoreductase (nitroreductase family)